MIDRTPTDDPIEIIELIVRQQARNRARAAIETRTVITGYLLKRGRQFAGVHLS